ncbi:hypothetical protein [Lishizhenia tianjinensis]|uniref:hypothetical protein n=1 Tax=Lishizhenia tianjinensis TaxID=477690 RepID=UPI000B7CDDB9|nr:hypothetical protein [Lishizhenia tianjinensis]
MLGTNITILENVTEEKPIAVIGNYEFFLQSEKNYKLNIPVGEINYIQKRLNGKTINQIKITYAKNSSLKFVQFKDKFVIIEEDLNQSEHLKSILIRVYDPFLRCIKEKRLFNVQTMDEQCFTEIQYLYDDENLFIVGTSIINESNTQVEIHRFDYTGLVTKIDQYIVPLGIADFKIYKAIVYKNALNLLERRTENNTINFNLKNYNLTTSEKVDFPLDMLKSQYHLAEFEIEFNNDKILLFGFTSFLVDSEKLFGSIILEYDLSTGIRTRYEIESIPKAQGKTYELCSLLTAIKCGNGSIILIGEYKKFDFEYDYTNQKFVICDHSNFIILKLNTDRQIESINIFDRFVSDVNIPYSNVLCHFNNGILNILYYNNYALVLKKVDLNKNEENTIEIFKRDYGDLPFFNLSNYERLNETTYIINAGINTMPRKLKVEF